jgi:hypothetical protein
MSNIEKNLARIRADIQRFAAASGRSAEEVKLLAVSKTKPASDIRVAVASGQHDFGENYLQEAQRKQSELGDLDLTWHFIGPIQSNKTRAISQAFDWVHSVDRLKIAQRLNDQRPDDRAPLNVLLQVNIDREASKSGVDPEQVHSLATQLAGLNHLRLRGLMAIPSIDGAMDQPDNAFSRMRQLFDELRNDHPACDTLSMGMSGDMQAAIAQGSTLVRIGTAIFGERSKQTHE